MHLRDRVNPAQQHPGSTVEASAARHRLGTRRLRPRCAFSCWRPRDVVSAIPPHRYIWLGTSTRRKGVAILLGTTDSHGRRAIVKILHEVSRKEEIQSPVHSDSNLLLDTWELE